MSTANKPNPRRARVTNRVQPEVRSTFIKHRKLIADTRRKMALDLGVTEQALQKVENGTGDASLFMCFVYAHYLHANIYELFPDVVREAQLYVSQQQLSVTTSL